MDAGRTGHGTGSSDGAGGAGSVSGSIGSAGGPLPSDAATLIDDPARGGRARHAAPAFDISATTRIGRYTVLRKLGAGSMGLVLSAYDEELNRRVAIKLLRGSHVRSGPERMRREAQALARLSHPNVVQIHDVGVHEGSLFIAMEYIEGETLRRWLKRESRPWRDVLAMLRQVGDGLAAAHRAGLVHRDLKPDNVLIGEDGRARVLDFGLVRTGNESQSDGESDPSMSASDRILYRLSDSDSYGAPELTGDGAWIGTPAYMSPEQHLRRGADERSDQFSFCVMAHEALYRERPFKAPDIPSLRIAVVAGRVRAPPRNSGVPAWLGRVIARGLTVDPDERWSSMDALLQALSRDPARRWQTLGVAAAVVSVSAGIAVVSTRERAERAAICSGGEAKIETAWNAGAAERVGAAFENTGLTYAAGTWARVKPVFDAYADAWVGEHREACAATRVRGEQSEVRMDARMRCLDHRLRGLRALVDVFREADARVVERAIAAVGELPPVAACADPEHLGGSLELGGAEEPARVSALRERLAAAVALGRAGKLKDGVSAARLVLGDAEADAEPAVVLGFIAEVQLQLGVMHSGLSDFAAAEEALKGAYVRAEQGALDGLAFTAATELVFVVGRQHERFGAGRLWAELARAKMARAPEGASDNEWMLLHNLGTLHEAEGSYDSALELLGRAHALVVRKRGPTHLDTARVTSSLATAQQRLGLHDAARETMHRALSIYEELLGEGHFGLVEHLGNMGATLAYSGAMDESAEVMRRAVKLSEGSVGPAHTATARARVHLATVLTMDSKYDDALAEYGRALAILDGLDNVDPVLLGTCLNNLAGLHEYRKEPAEALRVHERALAMRLRELPPDHPHVAYSHEGMANALLVLGRKDEAREHAEAALEIREKRAGDIVDRAATHLMLARTLEGVDDARALELARRARAEIDQAEGTRGVDLIPEIDAWLAAHEPPASTPEKP